MKYDRDMMSKIIAVFRKDNMPVVLTSNVEDICNTYEKYSFST